MLYFITGIFRNCLQEGELGKVRFQAGKLEHIPDLLPIFIMFVFKAGNIGDGMPRSGLIYIQRGMLG